MIILHRLIRESPNLEGQVSLFILPKNMVAQLYHQALSSFFVASYNSQGYGGVKVKVHYDRRSVANMSWYQASIWDPRPIFLIFITYF
jgi:hypothetical protein